MINRLYLGANVYRDIFGFLYFALLVALVLLYLARSRKLNAEGIIHSSLSRVLIWMATCSYSVYVVQWPSLHGFKSLLRYYGIELTPGVHVGILGAMLIVAQMCYVVAGEPSHKWA